VGALDFPSAVLVCIAVIIAISSILVVFFHEALFGHSVGVYGLSAPVSASGGFTFEATTFAWDDASSALSFPYKQGQIRLYRTFEKSFGATDTYLCYEVNGLYLGRCDNTGQIYNGDLRKAVEFGLRAWRAEAEGTQAAALASLR